MQIKLNHSAIYDLAILQLRAQGLEVESIKNHKDGTVEITGQRFAASKTGGEPFSCNYSWPLDVSLLHRDGRVFEAYPANPETYIHAGGKDLKEAERNCWKFYQGILDCKKHEFERGEHIDGHSTCKKCGLFFKAFGPKQPCESCKATDYKLFKVSDFGSYYCQECWEKTNPGDRKIITRLFPRG